MEGLAALVNVLLAVHLLAVGVWLGGLVTLIVAVRSARGWDSASSGGVPPFTGLIQRLNRVLWGTLAIALAAGAALFILLDPLRSGGLSSDVGQLFVVKFAFVAILVVATAVHSIYLGPQVRRLRESGKSPEVVARWSRASGAFRIVILLATLATILVAIVIVNR